MKVVCDLDIAEEFLDPYGRDKAKIRLEAIAASGRKPGKLILVSAITPTPAGEGRTTTSIGLSQGLRRIGKRVALALRQPSRNQERSYRRSRSSHYPRDHAGELSVVNVNAVLNSFPAPPALAMRPRPSCLGDSGS